MCSFASAGHPAPFLNDREIALPGALPLGLIAGTGYKESAVHLNAGDHLALYTDGLLEARSTSGEPYGFDRVQDAVCGRIRRRKGYRSGGCVGQDDDITVVVLTRLGIGEASSARFSTPVFELPGNDERQSE